MAAKQTTPDSPERKTTPRGQLLKERSYHLGMVADLERQLGIKRPSPRTLKSGQKSGRM